MPQHLLATALAMFALLLTACNDGARQDDDDDELGPAGEEITQVDLQYYDAKPDLSADGTKVVFISGRNQTLEVFKFDLSTEDEAALLTEDDLGEALDVVLTADGSLAAVSVTKDGEAGIYLVKFDGSSDPSAVDSDVTGAISALSFSPDGAYLAYVRSATDGTGKKLYVTAIAADGSAGTPTLLSEETDDESSPTWITALAAGTYQVVTKVRDRTKFTETIVSRTFATGLASLSRITLSDTFAPGANVALTAASDGVFLALPNPVTGTRVKPLAPVGSAPSDDKINVLNSSYFLSKTGGDFDALEAFSLELTGLSMASASTLGVWTAREAYTCDEGDITFGTAMFAYDRSGESFTRLVPEFVDDEWQLTDDICITDKKETQLDRKILFAKVAASSTLTDYTVAYVTYYNDDDEVRLLKVSADGTAAFHEVSANPQPDK